MTHTATTYCIYLIKHTGVYFLTKSVERAFKQDGRLFGRLMWGRLFEHMANKLKIIMASYNYLVSSIYNSATPTHGRLLRCVSEEVGQV